MQDQVKEMNNQFCPCPFVTLEKFEMMTMCRGKKSGEEEIVTSLTLFDLKVELFELLREKEGSIDDD
jgi:hypothetical protein